MCTYKYHIPFLTSGNPSSGKFCPKKPVINVKGKKMMVTVVSCFILSFCPAEIVLKIKLIKLSLLCFSCCRFSVMIMQ